jgi:hypothetical protein
MYFATVLKSLMITVRSGVVTVFTEDIPDFLLEIHIPHAQTSFNMAPSIKENQLGLDLESRGGCALESSNTLVGSSSCNKRNMNLGAFVRHVRGKW